ncbi:uncharacterized protein [Onthophagus taurus]|uniref:uncharacterized protein n=1 Tax=Onthophagus taurus TaxID=166361 RepID=UPI0039BE91DD
MNKSERQLALIQNDNLLRNFDNYSYDLSLNNLAFTGIKERCVWHFIEDFHITTNFCVDIMHDIFERGCNYDLTALLNRLIFDLKLFRLSDLNSRINLFNYGELEKLNKPPAISGELSTFKLKMSASEMLSFTRYLGLMIGDLVPQNLDVWQLWIKLREIIDIVTCPVMRYEDINHLKISIEEHNMLHIKYFGNLKPKHHHLVHYPTVAEMSGPLIHMWCMRSEQKHRQSKLTSKVSGGFKNILHTLAVKEQLRLYYNLLTQKSEKYEFGSFIAENLNRLKEHFTQLNNNLTRFVKWVNIKGTIYKSGMIIVLNVEDIPLFASISYIATVREEIYFIYEKISSTGFDSHVNIL